MEKEIILDGKITNYLVNDNGEIINKKTNKKLKISKNGAVQLSIHGKNKKRSVAKLVAEAFLINPNPDIYLYVTNMDGNKMNNNLSNLKWISASENTEKVWEKRRENGTVFPIYERSENIVENIEKFLIKDNEKRIYIDNKPTSYVITKDGQIRNLKNNYILKPYLLATYPTVNLRINGKQKNKAVHRLVAETWIPNPKKLPLVDHINGDRTDFNIKNLRWVTHKENSNNKHSNIHIDKPIDTRPIFSIKELEDEFWIKNQENGYTVSNLGRVKNKNGRILKGSILDCGYIRYDCSSKSFLGHILIWETFNKKKKPKNMVINHINGNKMDNRITNLELVTQKENMQKALKETKVWDFKKVIEINDDGDVLREFLNASEAARAIGILPGSMRNTIRRNGRCYNGLKYKYVE